VPLDDIRTEHRVVLLAELAGAHGRLPADLLAPGLAADIAAGRAVPAATYHRALAALAGFRAKFWAAFGQADILLLLPAAPAVAPVGMATGDPSFVIPVTALGGPAVSVRAGMGSASNMPVGVMLTAAPGGDARVAAFLLHEADPALDL
jgi:aspartyl-tRNA(Asn)/glutamyl-tRNA(Gln) amidotransferase subunit A